jgi:transketolase C-terminal domain/subunit
VKLLLGIVQDSYLLTIEEHILSGGFGSWILEEANLGKSSVKISRIGINNSFTERFGDQNYMLNQFQITPEYSVDSFLKLRESSKSD